MWTGVSCTAEIIVAEIQIANHPTADERRQFRRRSYSRSDDGRRLQRCGTFRGRTQCGKRRVVERPEAAPDRIYHRSLDRVNGGIRQALIRKMGAVVDQSL